MIKNRFILTNIIILLMILILTAGCFENNEGSNGDDPSSILLTIKYGDYKVNYTIEDIEMLQSYSGKGGYIKTKLLPDLIVISDIIEYTGVRVPTLLDEIPNLPDNYNINVISDDGWTATYTLNETLGFVDVYNETGDIIPNITAVMILAYKEDGKYYSEIDPDGETGPLRIVLVENNVITSSRLWSKMIVSIEIVSLK